MDFTPTDQHVELFGLVALLNGCALPLDRGRRFFCLTELEISVMDKFNDRMAKGMYQYSIYSNSIFTWSERSDTKAWISKCGMVCKDLREMTVEQEIPKSEPGHDEGFGQPNKIPKLLPRMGSSMPCQSLKVEEKADADGEST